MNCLAINYFYLEKFKYFTFKFRIFYIIMLIKSSFPRGNQ